MRKGTTQKGTRYENYIANCFRAIGYEVYQARRHRRFRSGKWINEGEDVYSSDLITMPILKTIKDRRVLWVQVTAKSTYKRKELKMLRLPFDTSVSRPIIITHNTKGIFQTYEWLRNTGHFSETINWWFY